ncbi:glycosyltransferase [Actinomyces sp.]|uniref:glycosyltransferase n=1 Tax=Actinomyces sp. TaxID=29317 RepID=UPI00289FD236|nr:glycosyltransferase [Actinomyces sp.]
MADNLGYGVRVVSRYARDKGIEIEGVHQTDVIQTGEYVRVSDEIANDDALSEDDIEAGKRRLSKLREIGRKRLYEIAESWSAQDIVIALQVPILFELLECGFDLGADGRPTLLAEYHGTFEYAKAQPYFRTLVDSFNRVDQCIFLSAEDARLFEQSGVRKVTTIPNPVREARTSDQLLDRPTRAVFVGRLHPEKNLSAMIEGWSKVVKASPEWKLDIYGSGAEKKSLQAQVDRMGLADSVSLRGVVDSPSHAYSNARINLLTSPREGMPMSILEAASYGVPTVAFDAGPGTRELVADKRTGFLVGFGEIGLWADRVTELANNESLLRDFGEACVVQAQKYGVDKITDRWRNLLERVKVNGERRSVVSGLPERTPGEIRCEEIVVDPAVSQLRIGLCVEAPRALEEKAFLVCVTARDANGRDVTKRSIDLPWSKIVGSGFINSPALKKGRQWVTLDVPFRPSSTKTLQIRIVAWGRREFRPESLVKQTVLLEHRSGPDSDGWLSVSLAAKKGASK